MASSGSVPRVDFSLDEMEVAEQLISALTTVGFACLTNTGIWDKAKEFAAHSHSFFNQDPEYKSQFGRPAGSVTDNAGWVGSGVERLNSKRPGDFKECFNMMKTIKGNSQRAPSEFDNDMCWDLWDDFVQLSHKVLRVIGLGLKLKNPNLLSETHQFDDPKANQSVIRVIWYPKIDSDEVVSGQIRCGEHSDYGSITLLYTDSPGLQVMNRSTGQYEDSGYIEGGIFINIGDLLQMWSGDTLIANKHRVLVPEKEHLNKDRISVVFFCEPDDDVLIETLDGSGKYPPVKSGVWHQSRFAASYRNTN